MKKEIVVVESISFKLFVSLKEFFYLALFFDQAEFGVAYECGRLALLDFQAGSFGRDPHDGCVVIVRDDPDRFTEPFSEDSVAQRVDGGNFYGRGVGMFSYPFPHLIGSLAGVSDAEDLSLGVVPQDVQGFSGQGAGLSGSRPGHDQAGTIRGLDSGLLLRVDFLGDDSAGHA